MRLDIYLSKYYPEITRSQLQLYIKNGRVTVNGVTETKAGLNLGEDDAVVLDTKPLNFSNAKFSSRIEKLYEDSEFVAINKPAGMLTHSKGRLNDEETVASWLSSQYKLSFTKETDRNGIVHRLDRATSGVLVCAKNDKALKHLQNQFQKRTVEKVYIAIVEGEIEPLTALIDLPIERNPKQPQRFRVGSSGKTAQTTYKVEESNNDLSLVRLLPQTGRTHQLRVHMAYIKHPILGDDYYGGLKAERLYLHAKSLLFKLLNGDSKKITSSVPQDFQYMLWK